MRKGEEIVLTQKREQTKAKSRCEKPKKAASDHARIRKKGQVAVVEWIKAGFKAPAFKNAGHFVSSVLSPPQYSHHNEQYM